MLGKRLMPSRSSLPGSSGNPDPPPSPPPVVLSGLGVSAGIAIGTALVVGRRSRDVVEIELGPDQVEAEISRLRDALDLSSSQIAALQKQVADILGEKDARVFDAHLLLVGDELLIDEVIRQIRERRRNAEFVFMAVLDRYVKALDAVEDPYIRERLRDIQDVADRVVSNLRGEQRVDLTHLPGPRVVVAYDLSPSETASMDRHNVEGYTTCIGSRTSHAAIMARAMGIPAVVGAADLTARIETGDHVILDGQRGVIIGNPSESQLADYRERIESQQQWFRRIEEESKLPAETIDGFRVQLAANIELPEEVETVKGSYGVGIGLFRTEYLFFNRPEVPGEEEQFKAYRRATEEIYPQSVIFRTLDIGGDKFLSQIKLPSEMNPFLGVRAIRFCLAQPQIFTDQLRAILRASAHGKVRILFPMISTLEELLQALEFFKNAQRDLDREGIPYNRHMDIGMMIEVPSAALIADQLAPHVDFFSLGTNDLVQYALAVDRANTDISHLYQPCHPAIIRLLRSVLQAAWSHGKWVSICGEMAGDPILVPLVLGLGIHELSMSPVAIGLVKRLIRRVRMHDAEYLVQRALSCGTGAEVSLLCEKLVKKIAPDLYSLVVAQGQKNGEA